ncbi:ATP-binding protein [Oceanirhabdus seepicola]|uniref:histidine kinase n=1 Tax=Oceanirhabdus seepicola TaxID=2828781 RepID=A0A9J6NXX2_9CLOT|nr:ATP-binding protein [Oceanirhabdus seepicola]MCM1988477.1 HAMP domain-containing protein [Oceanirhabdus seepicola]
MKLKGIVFKLFILILSVVLIIQIFQFTFQSIFLGTFYETSMINNIESKISSLKTSLTKEYSEKLPSTPQGANKLNNTLLKFSHKNSSAVIIYDLYGNSRFGIPSNQSEGLLYVKVGDNDQVKVDISPEALKELVSTPSFSLGSDIIIKGEFIISENIMYPLEILIDNDSFIVNDIYESADSNSEKTSKNNNYNQNDDYYENISEFNCEIVFINYTDITYNIWDSYDSLESILFNEFNNYLDLNNENQSIDILNLEEVYYKTDTEFYETESIVFFEPIKLNNEQFILGVSIPYTPIENTVYIIQNYYVYYFFFALIVIIVASFLLSKLLSSPLLKLNQTAHKMASLDFSKKCDIVSNDELGTLSESLNTLSSNLQCYKTDLDSANIKLKEQLDFKEMQENIRKEFMANISHELKTPLTVMNGILEGIEDNIYTESPEKYLGILKEEVDYMKSMVYELLELSKLDSPSFKLNKSIVNLNDIFLKINNKFHTLVREKSLTVNFNYEDGFVIGDRNKLTEVISNLFLNAIKYSPSNEEINVLITNINDRVMFSIENTGTHIPIEDIPKVWQEFYRVEKSRNRDSGGTGLGLLIVKKILDKHGSSYNVVNTSNGVQFSFEVASVKE